LPYIPIVAQKPKMLRLVRANTPLSDPNRLPCGHLRSRRHWYPWCRFCIQGPKYAIKEWKKKHPTNPCPHFWRAKHKGKHRKPIAKRVKHDRRRDINPNSMIQRKLRHKEEMRKIAYILFHLGQGRISKLPPRERSLVSAHRDKLYLEYLTRQRFADRKAMTKYCWARKIWYCGLRLVYSRGVTESVKTEIALG